MDLAGPADLRLLRQAVRHGGGWTVLLLAVAPLGAAAELCLPAVLGLAVDAALGAGHSWWPALACALVAVIVAGDALGDLASGSGTARSTARIRQHLLRHLLALDPRTAGRYPVGDLVGRLIGQAADTGHAGATVILGLTALLPSAGSVVALALLDPWLAVTFVAGLLLLAVLLRAFVADSSTAARGYLRAQAGIAGRLLEALAGARTIAAAGTLPAEIDRVLQPLPELRAHGERTWHALARAAGRTAAVAPLLQLAIIAVGGWSVSAGRLSAGQLVAAIGYAALGAGLGTVVNTLSRLVRTRAGAHRVAMILSEPARDHGSRALPPGAGRLRLRDVTVSAVDGRPILDRIDLDLPAGGTIAVIGPSGAGKSTLAEVAGRLRDPDSGDVLLDGLPLRELTPAALRRAVGYGFERPVLVGETVADVIGLGLDSTGDSAPPERVRRSARTASIDDFVERLPAGYRTPLAEVPMSGGEAQRLGLARALHGERLLVLDDATSSLDTATEHRIARALVTHLHGRTRLIVTHRTATAAAADVVAWLDAGRLRAVGRHRDLWADPAYRAVFQPPDQPVGGADQQPVGVDQSPVGADQPAGGPNQRPVSVDHSYVGANQPAGGGKQPRGGANGSSR
ncbi:ABC transporter ATP-binding protein [Solwaraspora sp. WMMD1047]|uniref:ABC transporter ATP-binding protein n=1 Tax=Solwaraspora sp. WMMD1047 TaxID=3016102 RepID=UPI00241718CD|nr:ABC transporter ATP-binding protein [Solwaraspora sp. WMMD1047]MDG4831168.1 ABC transporter ATP-binding protein [Solwaraspora sp. WMMD1047]